MRTKKMILRYSLRIRGVFGRNRTPKTDTITLVDECEPATPKTLAELLPLLHGKLRQIDFKSGVASIYEEPIELEIYEVDGQPRKSQRWTGGREIFSEKIEGRDRGSA